MVQQTASELEIAVGLAPAAAAPAQAPPLLLGPTLLPSAALASRPPAHSRAALGAIGARAGNSTVARVLARSPRPGGRCECGGTIGADGLCDKCRAAAAAGGQSDPTLALHSRPQANDALARMLRSDRRTLQRMLACPPRLMDTDPTPAGWKSYHGEPAVFHCGFRGILEDRAPTPADPQNECFYDHSGTLVDQSHQYAGCRGTPNQYDSAADPLDHTFRDSGGIYHAGAEAFFTSRVHDINTAVEAVVAAGAVVRSLLDGIAEAIALGLLTGIATVDPANWGALTVPARSARHLRVMGMILTSQSLAGSPQAMVQNLTKRLDSFSIAGLLSDLAEDINTAQRGRGPTAPQVSAERLGTLSMHQLVEFLSTQGLLAYARSPEAVARERMAAARAAQPAAQVP
jgi:hypothetical protein